MWQDQNSYQEIQLSVGCKNMACPGVSAAFSLVSKTQGRLKKQYTQFEGGGTSAEGLLLHMILKATKQSQSSKNKSTMCL